MKITETFPHNDDYEGRWELNMSTNTFKKGIRFGAGEPEDNSLARDLNDAYVIEGMLKEAYEAGKRGEEYEYESLTDSEN